LAEIYHMLPAATWEALAGEHEYHAPSLASEGFIHGTAGERNLIEVANRFYRGEPAAEWVVLVIDPARIRVNVRWVVQPDGLAYPHVHGPLNLDAVSDVHAFPRDPEGRFLAFFQR